MNAVKEPTAEYLPQDEHWVRVTEYTQDDLPELLAAAGYDQFQVLEWLNSQAVAFRKWFVDLSGDLIAGLMLSQIHYWHGNDKHGKTRLRVRKGGHLWLCRADNEWWDEIRITPKQANRARNILVKKGLIFTETHRFNNVPRTHIRINKPVFMGELATILTQEKPDLPQEESLTSPTGQIELPPQGKSLTEITTETTSENTYSANAETPRPSSPGKNSPQEGPPQLPGIPTLEPEGAGAEYLFAQLQREYAVKKQRAPARFQSLAQKEKFMAAEGKANGQLPGFVDAALQAGILPLKSVVAYVAACANGDKRKDPKVEVQKLPDGRTHTVVKGRL